MSEENKALFLDRDGVLIKDVHLLQKKEQVEVMTGMADVLAKAREKGYKLVVVTNQTVVSRGLATMEEVEALNHYISLCYAKENKSVSFDKIYVCPYHPDAQVEEYRKDSELRKPAPGMLFLAQKELNINLENSIMIGDRPSDIIAGNRAGCRTVLFCSGRESEPVIKSNLQYDENEMKPDFKIQSAQELLEIL